MTRMLTKFVPVDNDNYSETSGSSRFLFSGYIRSTVSTLMLYVSNTLIFSLQHLFLEPVRCCIVLYLYTSSADTGDVVGWELRYNRVQFPIGSLGFFMDLILPAALLSL